MGNIAVIGSINMDLVITTPVVPKMGETVAGSSFATVPGGKGANQAVACARLGGNVKMIGCVGNDVYGEMSLNNLRGSHVDVSGVEKADTNTGIAVITVCGGDNSIILEQGANRRVTAEWIEKYRAVIEWADIVVLQMEIPLEAVFAAARAAKESGAKVVLNPAPMVLFDAVLLRDVDFLVPNQFEAGALLNCEIASVDDARQAVARLNEMGVPTAIITLGGDGCVYNDGGRILHQPARKATPVDTTAAGDSFIGALCTCLCGEASGKNLTESVEFATAAAAITVTRKGAGISLPSLAEIKDLYQRRK